MRKIILGMIFLGMILALVLLGCSPGINPPDITQIVIGDTVVDVEIADSAEERAQGLMGRKSLGEQEGMLFVFDNEAKHSFWMKNTLVPLDIVFIDNDMKIVDYTTMQPCEAEPCQTYTPQEPVIYVLEVNAGFAQRHDIRVGDSVMFR